MKTNKKLVEAYNSLEEAVKTGTVETKILIFRNKQVVEPVVYPFIETQKQLNKKLDNYRNSISALYYEYGNDYGKGYPEVPMFALNEDGSFDTTKPNPKFTEFKEKLSTLESENKQLVEDHKSETESFNAIMESEVPQTVLDSMKFIVIDPAKDKIADEINIDPLLEFGIITIGEEKEEKKLKKKK